MHVVQGRRTNMALTFKVGPHKFSGVTQDVGEGDGDRAAKTHPTKVCMQWVFIGKADEKTISEEHRIHG